MLALDPTVVDAIWASFAAYLPEQGVCTAPARVSPAEDL